VVFPSTISLISNYIVNVKKKFTEIVFGKKIDNEIKKILTKPILPLPYPAGMTLTPTINIKNWEIMFGKTTFGKSSFVKNS